MSINKEKNPFSLIREDLPKSEEDLSLAELQGDLAALCQQGSRGLVPAGAPGEER